MGFWQSALLAIVIIGSVIELLAYFAAGDEVLDSALRWFLLAAFTTPLLALALYLVAPSLVNNSQVGIFFPFKRFWFPLARYRGVLTSCGTVVLLNSLLYYLRFRRPLFRFILLVTEPLVVIAIVVLVGSYYVQYFMASILAVPAQLQLFHGLLKAFWILNQTWFDVIIQFVGFLICAGGIILLVVVPLKRAVIVIWYVMRPYLTLELIRCRRCTRPLEFDRQESQTDVLVLSDLHIARNGTMEANLKPEVMFDWLRQLAATFKPKAAILCGDVTDLGDTASWAMAETFLRSLGIPTIAIPGNHDVHFKRLSGDVAARTWLNYFINFLTDYFDSAGAGVASFPADQVLSHLNRLSAIQIGEFPQLMRFADVPADFLLLDSNRRPSSSAVTNAIGYVGDAQLAIARRLIQSRPSPAGSLIVVLHHHIIPVASLATALLICADASRVLRFALEAGASLIVHGHTHMPDVFRYSRGTESITILSCGSALFPA